MSNDDDFWQLISAVKNTSLGDIEKNKQIDDFFISLEKEYWSVKNKDKIETSTDSSKLIDMNNAADSLGIFAQLFRKKRNLAIEYMMYFLKKTSKFSKNDLYLIKKLNLLKPLNNRVVCIYEGKSLSQISVMLISSLLSVIFFIWAVNLYFSFQVGIKEIAISGATGVFIGIGVRYILDRTIKKKKLVAHLKTVAPQLSQT